MIYLSLIPIAPTETALSPVSETAAKRVSTITRLTEMFSVSAPDVVVEKAECCAGLKGGWCGDSSQAQVPGHELQSLLNLDLLDLAITEDSFTEGKGRIRPQNLSEG